MTYEVIVEYTTFKTFLINSDTVINTENALEFVDDETKSEETDYWESSEKVTRIKELNVNTTNVKRTSWE